MRNQKAEVHFVEQRTINNYVLGLILLVGITGITCLTFGFLDGHRKGKTEAYDEAWQHLLELEGVDGMKVDFENGFYKYLVEQERI